ncbi:sialic acid-binding Ig-like lectin 5 [Entelurus aequoreus]|uniref:sialic acid-binding Ig-like lectin 5 n=1 Tax=Entelurus aequoreus TaxID=161455 RepID=UPI002B1D01EA|nr:sialic acid-binding Ig-like lectin 5 [Entelurus aequoreus]XP_061885851.1 sialic acid-binding Ig-like lectin 5 [Entelurus aequoreus]
MILLVWSALLLHMSVCRGQASQSDYACWGGFCIHVGSRQITSEVGLCAVLPCSYSAENFTPQSVVWFKCDQDKKCTNSDIVFHSKNMNKTRNSFKGKISLLEQDVSRRNCSIIIHDLSQSDSGFYQLRINGLFGGNTDGFNFNQHRVQLRVKELKQKPTVLIPTLTAGRPAALTCTAPGLCSKDAPAFNWTWRRAGDDSPHVLSGNLTLARRNLSDFTQRHSATLTLNPSAEQHGTRVTCSVAFKGVNATTEETATLNVTYVKTPSITGQTTVKEGDTLNLSCSVDSFPPSRVTWSLLDSHETKPHTELTQAVGTAYLVIPNVAAVHSGRYVCAANHSAATLTAHVDMTVTWFAGILDGSGCVMQAAGLTCVCISRGVPHPVVTWPSLENRTEYHAGTIASNDTVSSIALTVGGRHLSAVECVSSHKDGQAKKFLSIETKTLEPEDSRVETFASVLRADVIIAFLVGTLLSAILCLLPMICCSCRQTKKNSCPLDLEMVSPREESEETDAERGEGEGGDVNGEDKADVDYAYINFSVLRRNNARGAAPKHEATEYAEIKKAGCRNDGKSEQLLECQGTQEGGPQCGELKEDEEVLYSDVKETMMCNDVIDGHGDN